MMTGGALLSIALLTLLSTLLARLASPSTVSALTYFSARRPQALPLRPCSSDGSIAPHSFAERGLGFLRFGFVLAKPVFVIV